MKKIISAVTCLLLVIKCLNAQQHQMSKQYTAPTDTLVKQKLASWQNLKFGLFMHWGTYSQWGVV